MIWQLLVLGLVQGVTEFLPVSSSAHLILPSALLGWPDQGATFDVAVHLGTLTAVLISLRKTVLPVCRDSWRQITGTAPATCNSRLGWFLVVATVPAVLFGALVSLTGWDERLRSTAVLALATLLFGLLLGWADRMGSRQQPMEKLTFRQVIIIGLCQALAIIPGTSRSGITITAALMLGLSREAAANFSFLLSIPVIMAASTLKMFSLITADSPVLWNELIFGMVVSGVSGYLCIRCFLTFINRLGMMPFVVYRLLLGAILISVAWL